MALNKWTPTTDLMTLRRLGKTCEELGELVAVLGRTICQGLDGVDPATQEGNIERMTKESADVLAQIGCNIRAFKLDSERINKRVIDKRAQMDEWEAMFVPAAAPAPAPARWAPRFGELVRYGDGVTALALHGDPHAGGWHGLQCMGGHTFYSTPTEPTHFDRVTWVDCAMRYRKQPMEHAMREAGLPLKGA